MKYFPLISILLCGCANPPTPARTTVVISSRAQPQTVIVPTPAQYIFPPQPVPAIKSLTLNWSPSADTNVIGYVVQYSYDLHNFIRLTNVVGTSAIVPASYWKEYYRVLSVNVDGLNSEGFYERID